MKEEIITRQVNRGIAIYFWVSLLMHLPEVIRGFQQGWNSLQ